MKGNNVMAVTMLELLVSALPMLLGLVLLPIMIMVAIVTMVIVVLVLPTLVLVGSTNDEWNTAANEVSGDAAFPGLCNHRL